MSDPADGMSGSERASGRWRWTQFWIGLLSGVVLALVLPTVIGASLGLYRQAQVPEPPSSTEDPASLDVGEQSAKQYLDRAFPGATSDGAFTLGSTSDDYFAIVDVEWGSGSAAQAHKLVVNLLTHQVVATMTVDPGSGP